METKILNLILKKEPFEAIKSGKKKAEYRDYKPYWIKRLMNKDESFKQFDSVRFRNDYHKNAPTLLIEIKGIRINKSPRRKRSGYLNGTYFSFAASGGEFTQKRLKGEETGSYLKNILKLNWDSSLT